MRKKATHHAGARMSKSYALGFILSIICTLAAYFAVANHLLTGTLLITAILAIGLLQAFIQLILFIHLGRENAPRWNLHFFLFMLLVVTILVGGTIWIMTSLNYNLM